MIFVFRMFCKKIAWETWGTQLSFNNRPTNSLYAWREIVSTKNQVSFQELFDGVTEHQSQWNKFKSHCHLRCMAILRSVPSEKTWESLFQTLVKALRTQDAEETVLVFNNYGNNQEFFLNQQERINWVTNGRYYKRVYARKLPRMSQGKAYKQYLEYTENKAEHIDRFCKIHPARPQTLKTKRKCFI